MKPRFLLLVLICFGCSSKPPDKDIVITLTGNHQSLKISGFDRAIINEIGRDTSDQVWQTLLPVYRMPKDTDMKDFQKEQPGHYNIQDSLVIFTPDTPFAKGKTYFLRYYNYSGSKDAWQYVQKKKGTGGATHKDLLFRY
ncbi:hypothetical protein [Mucilaginibacter sp.]|jgi:hypothetical protein|uniref:hypothetical protein n=1 Tax=Mucilaginibacter sp. TaxID=1882438 RepID=UPI002BA6DB8E|nr:hypothetical protein [Mucilaginibacter sp.]HTI60317.1 hypothetical protein [Mucilaginibacter sp.]